MSHSQTTGKWLLALFAVLVSGWTAAQLIDIDEDLARGLAVGFALVAAIHGSWRIVPVMALSFVFAQAIWWGLFYSVDHYIPDSDDVLTFAAAGLNLAAVCGAGCMWYWSEESHHAKNTLHQLVPKAVFFAALFLEGRYVGGIAYFAIYYAPAAQQIIAFAFAIGYAMLLWFAAMLLSRASRNGSGASVCADLSAGAPSLSG